MAAHGWTRTRSLGAPRASEAVAATPALALALGAALAACTHPHRVAAPVPASSVQVGACGEPGHDGVMGRAPRIDRADRDLDGDGRPEAIVVDRSLCTPDGNCHWNVFTAGEVGACARYIGTFDGIALEPLASKGDDNMRDVRAYWKQAGGRMLLQSYRYTRGGYAITDVLQCKRASDDRLECADTEP
jgi:hypothetical protein